ncbi:type II secretion system F family protein [Fulvimonas sp. R45]|uniref:type II secretion system F family protein n=1 Tax=Fulvimonas sp. R45 TaxID=3045937 RepID=UPI0026603123|nr:type II secretion system F family protein [Fulvimonas sp. R45]MDO1528430.1 type II secretion system F family protein [Fulvimonas sp. R45]
MSAAALLVLALVALALGVLVLALGALARYRSDRQQAQVMERALQHQPLALPPDERDTRSLRRRVLDALQAIGRRFEHGGLGKALLAPEDRLLLDQANRNTAAGRATYLGLRLVLALLLPVVVALWLRPSGVKAAAELAAGLAAGVLLPKFVLSAWAERLRRQATDELPLLIDLLRLFQGVGFSMDQSLQTIAERFPTVLPVLGRELRDANTAYMHGRPRAQSLRRLAESFDNDDLRSLVQVIVQVHEHGGAVQEPLRQFAERLREQRKMTMKEKTGKLSVKMTVVMMLTLLPALMLVLAGPAVVSLIGTMSKLGGH